MKCSEVLECFRSTHSSIPSMKIRKLVVRQAATASCFCLAWQCSTPDAFTDVSDTQAWLLAEKKSDYAGNMGTSHACAFEFNVGVVRDMTGRAHKMTGCRYVRFDSVITIAWWSDAAKLGN